VIANPKGRTAFVQPVDTAAGDVSTWPFGGDAA
jgi:hypothetical protein